MPRPIPIRAKRQQPINWVRAFVSGVIGATGMIAVIDCFAAVGLTPFCLETYLGSMIYGDPHSPYSWTLGLFATWALGGIFGFFYAYFFEYVFHRASAKIGCLLGLGHAALAAIAFFPFFQILQHEMGTAPVPEFGFFGSGMGWLTPILLVAAHVMFGAGMGTFYGPVRADRAHARAFESGEVAEPGDPDAITQDFDHPDSDIVNW